MAEPGVALFWGEDEFLLRLAAHGLLKSRGVRATEVDAGDWRGGELSDLATPSLLGEARALLVLGCQALPDAGAKELRAYLPAPSPDALCVLTLVSAARSAPPLARAVRDAGGLVRQLAVKRPDLPRWVMERASARGRRMTGPAAAALVATLGEGAAVLDQAVEQLASAFPQGVLGPEQVGAQFEGSGEHRVWELCDHAFSGRVGQALVTLRSLLEAKEDPLLILGGVASRVRDLLRVRSLPDRMPAAEAARAAGLRFDWQVRRYRQQAARFDLDRLATLHRQVTETDRALKAGAPGDVVLPPLVAAMAGETSAVLDVPLRVGR